MTELAYKMVVLSLVFAQLLTVDQYDCDELIDPCEFVVTVEYVGRTFLSGGGSSI